MEGRGELHTPAASPPKKELHISTRQEVGWAPELVLASAGNRILEVSGQLPTKAASMPGKELPLLIR
jgi:hypothetical protein